MKLSKEAGFSELLIPGFFAFEGKVRYLFGKSHWGFLTHQTSFCHSQHGIFELVFAEGMDGLIRHIRLDNTSEILHLYKGRLLSVTNGCGQYNPLAKWRFREGIPECPEVFPALTQCNETLEDKYNVLDAILKTPLKERLLDAYPREMEAAVRMRRRITLALHNISHCHPIPADCAIERLTKDVSLFQETFSAYLAAEKDVPQSAD